MGISTDNRYDVIVIGSGLGGLSAALHLAKKGLHVLVLEKQPKIGGFCQNYLRGDYEFDVSLHVLPAMRPGQGAYRLLDYLEVFDKLDVLQFDPMFSSSFPDRSYAWPGGGAEPVLEYLQSEFPAEKEGLASFMDTIKKLVHSNTELFWSGQVDFDDFYPTRYYGKTYEQLLNEFVKNPRLQGLLGQLWQSTGLPNSRCAANWGVEVNGWHQLSGNYYIRGGGQRLSLLLADNLRALGNVVKTTALVRKILQEKRKIQGVELESGERFYAPIVVSNASPLQTLLQLIDEDQLGPSYVKRLRAMETSCSLITLYMGLDCPASEVGIDHHTLFVNYQDTNEETYRLAMAEAYDKTDFVVSNYTDDKGGKHPRGQGIIQMAEVAPGAPWLDISRAEYGEKKRRCVDTLLAKLDRHYPEARKHITLMELATPRTMSLATRNPGGSVYGFAQTPEQADNSRFGAQSSFKGLYFAGAWCRGGGGGYMGSIINGRVCARHVLKREGLMEAPDVAVPRFQESAEGPAAPPEPVSGAPRHTLEPDQVTPDGELSETGALAIVLRAVNDFLAARAEGSAPQRASFFHLRLLLVPYVEVTAGDAIDVDVKMTATKPGKAQFDVAAFQRRTGKKLLDLNGNALLR